MIGYTQQQGQEHIYNILFVYEKYAFVFISTSHYLLAKQVTEGRDLAERCTL